MIILHVIFVGNLYHKKKFVLKLYENWLEWIFCMKTFFDMHIDIYGSNLHNITMETVPQYHMFGY